MFDTRGTHSSAPTRKPSTLEKLDRMNKALSHEEPDRVPISDFFWGGFTERWRKELDLPDDANPYFYYDLDWIVSVPNMDPWIREFETLSETADEVVVRTGFGAEMHKRFTYPMPEMRAWEVDSFEKLQAAEFDDPGDSRRFLQAGDNHLAGVGDGFERNTPAWIDTVRSLHPDIPVYGSMVEVSECLTRLVGQGNSMLWAGMYPKELGEVIARIGAFYLACARAELEAADGLLDGFVIWGDVAYAAGTFVSPEYWRAHFKPWVAEMTSLVHDHGLPVIYHGCGNVNTIFEDFIEIGVDGLNPLEVKAGMDVLDLRERHGHKMCFCGNSDIQVWETGDEDAIRLEVLHRLKAAEGGGLVFLSDHSVSSSVSGRTYDMIVKLVREYGRYPLDLSGLEAE